MPLAPRGSRWRGRAAFALWRPIGGIARRVRAIVADPFRADPAGALSRSPAARLRDRRMALIRLILLCVVLVAGPAIVPVVVGTHAPPLLLAAVAAGLLLSVVCLIVNQGGYPTPAALLFIVGALAVGVASTRLSPAALPSAQGIVLLIYATMSLLILLAGSVLPPVFVWLVAGLVIAVTLTGLLGRPVAAVGRGAGPGPGPGPVQGPGLTAVALVVALQALVAVMSWVAAQSAAASAATANAALDQARELTALKDQFLIDANHELRTPIMAWYGNTELLANFGTRATQEQRQRMLERALASGDAVLQLLNAVLDAGALGSGPPRLRLSAVAVEPLVREVLATFDPREIAEPGLEDVSYAARQVTVTIEPELMMVADPSRLRQILVNLLTNALKYSAPQTPITISGAALPPPRSAPRWRLPRRRVTPLRRMGRLSVRDEGLGVPPRDAPKLFNRFVRLERDIAGPVRGTGVGLYLCRVLTEAMGGRIWLESSGVEGDGSTFSIALPLASSAAPAVAPPQREAAGAVSGPIGPAHEG